jgi:hypothetical protein
VTGDEILVTEDIAQILPVIRSKENKDFANYGHGIRLLLSFLFDALAGAPCK